MKPGDLVQFRDDLWIRGDREGTTALVLNVTRQTDSETGDAWYEVEVLTGEEREWFTLQCFRGYEDSDNTLSEDAL